MTYWVTIEQLGSNKKTKAEETLRDRSGYQITHYKALHAPLQRRSANEQRTTTHERHCGVRQAPPP